MNDISQTIVMIIIKIPEMKVCQSFSGFSDSCRSFCGEDLTDIKEER